MRLASDALSPPEAPNESTGRALLWGKTSRTAPDSLARQWALAAGGFDRTGSWEDKYTFVIGFPRS